MENKELIEFAENCGLKFTGEYEDGQPQFIGDNVAWGRFNDGEECKFSPDCHCDDCETQHITGLTSAI